MVQFLVQFFIIYINNLFIVNHDTNPFITGMSFEQIVPELESTYRERFMNDNVKDNAGKNLFLSQYEYQRIKV